MLIVKVPEDMPDLNGLPGVEIEGGISNTTGSDEGYADFPCISMIMTKGESYNITLTQGYASTPYNEYFRVWIDYNRDGDFSDNSELAYDAGEGLTTPATGSITIPENAQTGETRLRVAMKWVDATDLDAPEECMNFQFGEVEDYTVNIIDNIAVLCSAPLSANAEKCRNGRCRYFLDIGIRCHLTMP